jgi:cAMP-dependent protein kinase regulator
MNLADALVPRQYTDNQMIIKQGDSADGMYFVEEGSIKITITGESGQEVEVGALCFSKIKIEKTVKHYVR